MKANLPISSSFLFGEELIAGKDSTGEASESHLRVAEIEAEELLGELNGLTSSDHISQSLNQVESVIELFLAQSCKFILENTSALLLLRQL